MSGRHRAAALVAAAVLGSGLQVVISPLVSPSPAGAVDASYRQTVLDDDPAGYWRLNETAGAATLAADNVGDRDAVFLGGCTPLNPGLVTGGRASRLSGAAGTYVQIANDANWNFSISDKFTVEVWTKVTAPTADRLQMLVDKTNATTASGQWGIWYDNRSSQGSPKRVRFQFSSSATPAFVDWTGADTALAAGGLLHVTYDGSGDKKLRLYWDGVLKGTSTAAVSAALANSLPVVVGARAGNKDFNLDGVVDELAIYRGTVLAGTQMVSHYDIGRGAVSGDYAATIGADGATGHWRFDEDPVVAQNVATAMEDASTHDRDGSYPLQPALDQASLVGNDNDRAARFLGPGLYSRGEVLSSAGLNFGGSDFTVEAWVKRSPGTFTESEVFVSKYSTSSDRGFLGAFLTDGRLQFAIRDGRNTYWSVTSAESFDDGRVHAVHGVRRGARLELFVDGVLYTWLNLGSAQSVSSTVPLVFGNSSAQTDGSRSYRGYLDDVAVYAHALSAAQVRQHYAASGRSVPVPAAQTRGGSHHNVSTTVRRADPVDTATGAFVDSALDMTTSGPGVDFKFERTYNSNDSAVGTLGRGWSHPLATSLQVAADGRATVRAEDGAELVFMPTVSGAYERPAGVTSTLIAVAGGFELVRVDQVRYRFDAAGRLLSVKDRDDHGVTVGYDAANRPASVTDAAGRSFNLSYNGDGRIGAVTAPPGDGRSVTYAYTGDLLVSATDVRGGVTQYEYDGSGRLTRITDPEGHPQVRNTYNSDGRVIEQLDPMGNLTTFAWDAATQTSTMTDPTGATWIDAYAGNVLASSTEPSGTSSVQFDADLNVARTSAADGDTWRETYDSRGNVLTRTSPDPFAYTEAWTYDAANNPVTHTDARGNTTAYTYDASGRLTAVTFPSGAAETRTYTAGGQVATITDARSNTTTYAYDAWGNLTSETAPGGGVTTYTRDAAGRRLSRTSPRGNAPGGNPAHHTATWTYDAAGNVLTATDELGRTTTSTYDDNGQVLTRTDALGRVTSYVYNAAGELVTETAPGGLVTTSEYDNRGQLTKVTSSSGSVTTYAYDGGGRMTSMVEPRGNVVGATPADYRWTHGYDSNGNQTSVTDPLGNETLSAYDELNRLVSVTDPNNHVTTFTYDANSNRTSVTNHLGQTTIYAFDSRDRMSATTNPVGKTWSYGYDGNGNLTSETTPLGFVTTRSYDADNRLINVVDPLGNIAGGVPADHDTMFSYDADGNVVTESDQLGHTSTLGYDRVGNRVTRTDALNNTTTWGFDALNRLTSVAAPASGGTSYTYNAAGDLATRTDANSHTTTYGYDGEHRLTSVTSPTGQQWTYGYDAAGNRTSSVDAKANAAGVVALGKTTATFDRAGRLVGVDYSDTTPDVSYTYDGSGNRTSMVDALGTETRTYDAANRLTGVARGTDSFSYGYDAAGRITSRTYPDGTVTTLAYTYDGQLATVAAPEGTTAYTYDPAGRLSTTTLPNGVVETRNHDNGHRLTAIEGTKGTTTLSSFAYTRDAVGNPIEVVAPTGTQTYGYDAAHRITSVCYAATCSAGSADLTTWTYDSVGNRLTEETGSAIRTYSYNAADQLTSSSLAGVTTSYGYDANGKQTVAGVNTFTYDIAGHMTAATDAAQSATYAYAHDGDGKRLRTTATTPPGTTVTNDAWDITQPVAEIAVQRDGAGTVTRRFGYGLDRISMTAGSTSFYLHDGIGSVAKLTSSVGDPQQSYTYSPFGDTRSVVTHDPAAPDQPMLFAGEQLDATGLYHLRARQYSPGTGRFTATDPLAPEVTDSYVSSYAYTNNRPTVMIDPTGEKGRHVGAVGGFGPHNDFEMNVLLPLAVGELPENKHVKGHIFSAEQIDLIFDVGGLCTGSKAMFSTCAYEAWDVDNVARGYGSAKLRGTPGKLAAACIAYCPLLVGAANLAVKATTQVVVKRAATKALASARQGIGAADDIGLSGRGLVPAAGTRVRPAGIPDEWRIVPTRSGGGVRYYDPTNPGNSVRVMQGSPNSPFPNSQAPYVRWQRNGQPLDVNGNVLPTANSPDAHIPLGDFRFLPGIF